MNIALREPEETTLDESAQSLHLWAALPLEGRTRALRLLRALLSASQIHHKDLEHMGILVPVAHQPQMKPKGMVKDYEAYYWAAISMGASAKKLLVTPYVQGFAPTVNLDEATACFEAPLAKGFILNNLLPKAREWLSKKRRDAYPNGRKHEINTNWLSEKAFQGRRTKGEELAGFWCPHQLVGRSWNILMYQIALRELGLTPEEAWDNLQGIIPPQAPCPRLDEALKPRAQRRGRAQA